MGFYPTSHWLSERIRVAAENIDEVGANGASLRRWLLMAGLPVIGVTLIVAEAKFSWAQSRILAFAAQRLNYSVEAGPGETMSYGNPGPYDIRLGYSRLAAILPRLQDRGYEIQRQARGPAVSGWLRQAGVNPIYHPKAQAGLEILDRNDQTMFAFYDPRRVYPDFDSIPPLVVQTLLFIENRDLLDADKPHRNPVVEWDRLALAGAGYLRHQVDSSHRVIGGSTLASQLEKLRHSPDGRTHSPAEKLRQILSASLRIYQDGRNTLASQRRMIQDYINSIPLAAAPYWGEVTGLGDGLTVWYQTDFDKANRLLASADKTLTPALFKEKAQVYRQVLSLFLAMRQPSRYLRHNPEGLAVQTDRYLRVLSSNGVITPAFRDAALGAPVRPEPRNTRRGTSDFVTTKAADGIRVELLQLMGLPDTYSLDRLDLRVRTTIDQDAQQAVSAFLTGLATPASARDAGVVGHNLLSSGDPAQVRYAFILFEKGEEGNLLRVQADNLNQPLRINDGTRLQLGSTAKLRTLILYLELIHKLHSEMSAATPGRLSEMRILQRDPLTAWALQYWETTKDRSLKAILEAALDRRYSGNPGEAFFTAGGRHWFGNFMRAENGWNVPVSEAFQHSVNLVFIRIMRDIASYYTSRLPGVSPTLLTEPGDPQRKRYLARFADQEGAVFLRRFFDKYVGQNPDEALVAAVRGNRPNPLRAAVVFRSVKPEASLQAFEGFMKELVPEPLLRGRDLTEYYDKYEVTKFNLADRGYLANLHPLEIWLLAYRQKYPGAGWTELLAQSTSVRQDVYQWLLRPNRWEAQNKRIRILLEQDAFLEVGKAWRRLGYPFAAVVPSFATALGVSGDTPQALAELAGIVLNDGIRYPVVDVRQLSFGRETPMEAVAGVKPSKGERLLASEIAALVRREMGGVVEKGTGMRAAKAFVLPNGTSLPVGGKTGTGDNRFKIFGSGGRLMGERVVSRTGTFVFHIGDRFFGTVTAYVPGEEGGGYHFTSALPVQILKALAPQLLPLVASEPGNDLAVVR